MKKFVLYFISVVIVSTIVLVVSCKKDRNKISVVSVTLNKEEITMGLGGTVRLIATVLPDGATNPNVSWHSSDTGVAEVDDDGLVAAIDEGGCTITVTTEDGGKTATCAVTVRVGVTGIELQPKVLELSVGNAETLSATVVPDNAFNKEFVWHSSNEEVATVDGTGLVFAISAGNAVITVTTDDGGYEDACAVTVKGQVTYNLFRPIVGFLRTDGAKFVDNNGEIVIRSMGNIYNRADFKKMSEIGFNSVRYYMFAKDYEISVGNYGWYKLEQAIKWAKEFNLTLVLSMMDRPGTNASQFFNTPDYMDRLVNFWRSLAEEFKDEPAISGFGLMNEPPVTVLTGDNTPPFTRTYAMYETYVQKIVDAIREVDNNHCIIVEHLWLNGATEPTFGWYNTTPNDQRDLWRNANGKFDFPDIDDHNYAYEYHCYEPGRYVHQIPQAIQTQFNCSDCSGDQNRVYPSTTVAKWNEYDPETGKSWEMNKRFVEYSYTIPLDYCRNVKNVPVYIGEWGVMSCNFTPNNNGVNRGARQYILDAVDVFEKHRLSTSYHPFYVNEIYPVMYAAKEAAFREAFGTN